MTGRMNKVDQQLVFVRSTQKDEVERVVGHAIVGQKTTIEPEVDQKVAVLETRLEVKMNKAH